MLFDNWYFATHTRVAVTASCARSACLHVCVRSGLLWYDLVSATRETFWLRNSAPWFLRFGKQNLVWLVFMPMSKKWGLLFFLSCLEAQFCDFKGFFGNFDRDWRTKKKEKRKQARPHFFHIAMKNNRTKKYIPTLRKNGAKKIFV